MFLPRPINEDMNRGAADESKNDNLIPINEDPSKRYTFIARIDDET